MKAREIALFLICVAASIISTHPLSADQQRTNTGRRATFAPWSRA